MSAKRDDTLPEWVDPDEAPEWTDEMFDRAEISFGGHIIREASGTSTRRGRPPLGDAAKVQQSLRLSPEVLDYFRSTGPGWQARIDEVLRIHVRMVGEMRRSVAEALQAKPRVAEEQEGFRGEEEE
ncbi:MAG: BrnA antitoxin family protein [Allosphingosinicella sp.]